MESKYTMLIIFGVFIIIGIVCLAIKFPAGSIVSFIIAVLIIIFNISNWLQPDN